MIETLCSSLIKQEEIRFHPSYISSFRGWVCRETYCLSGGSWIICWREWPEQVLGTKQQQDECGSRGIPKFGDTGLSLYLWSIFLPDSLLFFYFVFVLIYLFWKCLVHPCPSRIQPVLSVLASGTRSYLLPQLLCHLQVQHCFLCRSSNTQSLYKWLFHLTLSPLKPWTHIPKRGL